MKSPYWLAAAVLALSSVAFAQNKLITLDDIFNPDPGQRVHFEGSPLFVRWSSDGRSFKQVVNGKLMRVDAITKQAVPYYDAGSLAGALRRIGVKAEEAEATANSPF